MDSYLFKKGKEKEKNVNKERKGREQKDMS